jgi:hypothetical protein
MMQVTGLPSCSSCFAGGLFVGIQGSGVQRKVGGLTAVSQPRYVPMNTYNTALTWVQVLHA